MDHERHSYFQNKMLSGADSSSVMTACEALIDLKTNGRIIYDKPVLMKNDDNEFRSLDGNFEPSSNDINSEADCSDQIVSYQRKSRKKFSRFRHKEYQCDDCDRMFTLKHNLQQHYVQYHMGCRELRKMSTSIKCHVCLRMYSSVAVLREHVQVVHGIKFYPSCSTCEKEFMSDSHLREHVKLYHGEQKKKRVKLEDELLRLEQEIAKVEKSPDIFACDICDEKFEKKDDMEAHASRHIEKQNELKGCKRTSEKVDLDEPKEEEEPKPKMSKKRDKKVKLVLPYHAPEPSSPKPSRTAFNPEKDAIKIVRKVAPKLSKADILAKIK